MENIGLLLSLIGIMASGFAAGYFYALNKFRHPDEAGSVSKNEYDGNLCVRQGGECLQSIPTDNEHCNGCKYWVKA